MSASPARPPEPEAARRPDALRASVQTGVSLLGDLLLGFAGTGAIAAVAAARVEALGTAVLPLDEALLALCIGAAGAFAVPDGSRLARIARAALVPLLGLLALSAIESANPVVGAVALAGPAFGMASAWTRRFRSGQGTGFALACFVGAAWSCAWLEPAFHGEAGRSAFAWVLGLIAALAWQFARDTRPALSDGPAVGARSFGAVAGALFAWAALLAHGHGPDPVAWPFAASSTRGLDVAAFGVLLASRIGAQAGARCSLLLALVAAMAVLAGHGSTAGATVAAVATSALVTAQLRLGGARPLALGFAVGACACVAAAELGLRPDGLVAAASAAAAFGLARRTVAGWVAGAVCASFAMAAWLQAAAPATSIDPAAERALDGHGAARASWDPRTQDVVLRIAGVEFDRSGPLRRHPELLAMTVALFADRSSPIAVVDTGLGRFEAMARRFGLGPLWIDSASSDAARLAPGLQVDGPVRSGVATQAAQSVAVGRRAFLRSIEAGTCDTVVDASLLGASPRTRLDAEDCELARHAAADGLVVAAFALDRADPALLASGIAAAAAAHPWCGVFVADRTALVVGLASAPDWTRASERFAALPVDARWDLHAAGFGAIDDVRDALAFVADAAYASGVSSDDGRSDDAGLDANVRVLLAAPVRERTALQEQRLRAMSADVDAWPAADEALAAAVRDAPACVLLRRELVRLRVRRADRAILAASRDKPDEVASAASMAARFLPFGCPSPALQAALALPNRRGERLRERRASAAAAFALDPGFYDDAPPLVRDVLEGVPRATPLADFARLPEGARLAELAVQDGPLGVLLRTRFASRAARALVDEWGQRDLSLAALSSLRELADPFVLEAAHGALVRRGAQKDLVRIWRADLPATAPIRALFDGPPEQRQALMVAIAGRTDAGSLSVLERGLVDDDEYVRAAAGAALFRSVGDGIVYDPAWPQDRLREAAAKLATLAQRTSR